MPHFLHGGVKVSAKMRRAHATVIRTLPDGTQRFMYPIWDRETAERALENVNSAKPPLSQDELRAVIDRAATYLTVRR